MDAGMVNMEQYADGKEQNNGSLQPRPYSLRKLQARDIPVFAKIIGKIGIDELVSCYGDEDFTELLRKLKVRKKILGEADPVGQDVLKQTDADENPDDEGEEEAKAGVKDDAWVMGIAVATRIANKVLQKTDRCMDEVYSLLGGLSGLSSEEISMLDLDVFLQMIMDVITGNNIANFIRAAIKFI